MSDVQALKLECVMASIYKDEYNCSKCLEIRGRNEDNMIVIRERKGCFKRQKMPLAVFDSDWEVYICPGRIFGNFEVDLLKDYHRLRDYSLLPYRGTLSDQPAWWVEAMDYLRSEEVSWHNIIAKEKEKHGK